MRITLGHATELKIIKNPSAAEKEEWEMFVRRHPNGNFFQSPQAYYFFSGVKDFLPHIILVCRNNEIAGVLLAVLIRSQGPKGYFSRRCIIWGGPLVKDNDASIASILLDRLNRDVSSHSIYTEFRNMFDTNSIFEAMLRNGFEYQDEANYIVEITQDANPADYLNESKKRQIKKSINNGARVIEAGNIEQVREYYTILSELYKEKIKKPLPGVQFFERFFQSKDIGRIFLVIYNDKVVGGITCPVFEKTIYEWYVCGLDREFKNVHPSVLATWAPIYYASIKGLKYFDFMGAGKPDEYYGVRKFKSQFGGKYVTFGRYKRINQKFMYKIGELGFILNQFL